MARLRAIPFKGAIMYVWDKKVQPEMDQQWNLTVQGEASADDDLPAWLRRPAWNTPDRSDAVRAENTDQRGGHPEPLLPGQSNLGGRPLHRIRNLQHRLRNLSRDAGRVAKAHFERSGGPGCLYLVPLHDQQQRILRYWGAATQATPGLRITRTCTTRMPITRVATSTRRTFWLPTLHMNCRSARVRRSAAT